MAVSRLPLENHPPQLMNFHLVRALAIKREKPHCDTRQKHGVAPNVKSHQEHGRQSHRFWGAQEPVSTYTSAQATVWQPELYCCWGAAAPSTGATHISPHPAPCGMLTQQAPTPEPHHASYARAATSLTQNGWRKDPGFPAIGHHLTFCWGGSFGVRSHFT